tara:strand:- start:133 stop:600 length:468 start_codon:yes stop_codon:yes gene_type:complete
MEVIIEVSKDSNLKYEFDESRNKLILDRVLHNSNIFPYNYGFIPNTMAPDNDPIDIILLSRHSLIPGCLVKVRVIGIIRTDDEKGRDDKIICVMENSVDKEFNDILDIDQLPNETLNKILYFLSHYKDGEENKFINVGEVSNRDIALRFIEDHKI